MFWERACSKIFPVMLARFTSLKTLTSSREIEEFSDFLRLMSSQWETAIHCHNTLSLLSTKIKQMQDDPNSAMTSHSYALRNVERTNDLLGSSNVHEQASRKSESQSRARSEPHYPTIPESLQRSSNDHGGPAVEPVPVISGHPPNLNADASPTEISPAQILEFQNIDTNYLAGGSTFDLNMGDLFGGSNFDSLLDMIGQQYSSF